MTVVSPMYDDFHYGNSVVIHSSEDPSGVIQAIIAVMRELGAIPKSDTAPQSAGNYPFRGIESIMVRLGPLLAKHGVVIVPHSQPVQGAKSPSMPDGWVDVVLTVHWRIYGPDGSFISAQTVGIGRDKSDKGSNKAMTQAFKYLLLELFAIADGEADSDGHTYEPHVVEAPTVPKPKQDELLARVSDLSDESKERLVEWFREHQVPAIRRLPPDRLEEVEAVLDHFENLEDAQLHEREGADDEG